MRIILYNSSSFGGCFDYGRELVKAYQTHKEVTSCEWWVPVNSELPESTSIRKLFLGDKPSVKGRFRKQLHFLFRVFYNPFLLFFRLSAAPDSIVILNDFEQLSAPLWSPLFRRFLSARHRFVVVLHDPDRDAYPPSLRWTRISMKALIRLADFAFFHDYLPEKSYYDREGKCRFVDIPHGIFQMPEPDGQFLEKIRSSVPKDYKIMSIPGNIRHEKNYETAIEALIELPDFALLIAGSPSSARVDVFQYKILVERLGLESRVIWMEHYLSASELSAVISASDVVVLNYAESFTSQSGILNVAAPFRKPLVVSDGPSSLASLVRKFGMGTLVMENSPSGLSKSILKALDNSREKEKSWANYLEFASWDRHVSTAVALFKEIS